MLLNFNIKICSKCKQEKSNASISELDAFAKGVLEVHAKEVDRDAS